VSSMEIRKLGLLILNMCRLEMGRTHICKMINMSSVKERLIPRKCLHARTQC